LLCVVVFHPLLTLSRLVGCGRRVKVRDIVEIAFQKPALDIDVGFISALS
jgi:hypothetical protein